MKRVVDFGLIAAVIFAFGTLVADIGAQTAKPPVAKPQVVAKPKVDGKTLKNPVPATAASVQAGRNVFFRNCATCHGTTGLGNGKMAPEGTKPSNFTDAKWDHGSTDGEVFVVVRDGVGPKFDMSGFGETLSEQDMWNVVNFIRTFSVKKP